MIGLPYANPHDMTLHGVWRVCITLLPTRTYPPFITPYPIMHTPPPPLLDPPPPLPERMAYLEGVQGKGAGREYYTNLCSKAVNQSIGRAIRHKVEYPTPTPIHP